MEERIIPSKSSNSGSACMCRNVAGKYVACINYYNIFTVMDNIDQLTKARMY